MSEQISKVTGAYVPSYWEDSVALNEEIRQARVRGEVHWHDATYRSNALRVATIEEIIMSVPPKPTPHPAPPLPPTEPAK